MLRRGFLKAMCAAGPTGLVVSLTDKLFGPPALWQDKELHAWFRAQTITAELDGGPNIEMVVFRQEDSMQVPLWRSRCEHDGRITLLQKSLRAWHVGPMRYEWSLRHVAATEKFTRGEKLTWWMRDLRDESIAAFGEIVVGGEITEIP